MNRERKKAHLVVLFVDFTVLVFDAKVASVSVEIFTHFNNIDKMYAWNIFEEEGVVKDLVIQLGDLDKSQLLPCLENIWRNAQQSTLYGPPYFTDNKPAAQLTKLTRNHHTILIPVHCNLRWLHAKLPRLAL